MHWKSGAASGSRTRVHSLWTKTFSALSCKMVGQMNAPGRLAVGRNRINKFEVCLHDMMDSEDRMLGGGRLVCVCVPNWSQRDGAIRIM